MSVCLSICRSVCSFFCLKYSTLFYLPLRLHMTLLTTSYNLLTLTITFVFLFFIGKKPFFNWISADSEIATARGGGGGLALWQRDLMMQDKEGQKRGIHIAHKHELHLKRILIQFIMEASNSVRLLQLFILPTLVGSLNFIFYFMD